VPLPGTETRCGGTHHPDGSRLSLPPRRNHLRSRLTFLLLCMHWEKGYCLRSAGIVCGDEHERILKRHAAFVPPIHMQYVACKGAATLRAPRLPAACCNTFSRNCAAACSLLLGFAYKTSLAVGHCYRTTCTCNTAGAAAPFSPLALCAWRVSSLHGAVPLGLGFFTCGQERALPVPCLYAVLPASLLHAWYGRFCSRTSAFPRCGKDGARHRCCWAFQLRMPATPPAFGAKPVSLYSLPAALLPLSARKLSPVSGVFWLSWKGRRRASSAQAARRLAPGRAVV